MEQSKIIDKLETYQQAAGLPRVPQRDRGQPGEGQGNRRHEPTTKPQGDAEACRLHDFAGVLHLQVGGARLAVLQANEEEWFV